MWIRALVQINATAPPILPGQAVDWPEAEANAFIRAGFAEPCAPPTSPRARGTIPETALKPPGGETTGLPGPRT